MKRRFVSVVLMSLLLVLLASCNAGPAIETPAPTPVQQESSASPSTTPDLGQMAKDAVSAVKKSEEENLTESELAIYNEVWAALDAEPNRPEEEIFEELAPNYDMTGSELKDFIMKAMEKVYK